MQNDLLLLSGNDIPFLAGQLIIHQPRIKEIAYLGEKNFFTGCELLKFSKEILTEEDKISLDQYSDFHILMSVLHEKNEATRFNVECTEQVLELIFPQYDFALVDTQSAESLKLGFSLKNDETKNICGFLDSNNFNAFKDILKAMLCLEKTSAEAYNPQGDLAKKIADKFKKREQQLAKLKNQQSSDKKINVYGRYISILTVGEQKDINSFMNYTVYQLLDEFQRYELKQAHDVFFQARLAGAKDMKEPEDWMKDIHE